MGRQTLLKIRQRLETFAPRGDLRRQRGADAQAHILFRFDTEYRRQKRIKREIRDRQRPGEPVAAHFFVQKIQFVEQAQLVFGNDAGIALGFRREPILNHQFVRFRPQIGVHLMGQTPRQCALLNVFREQRMICIADG